jgi:hypothetical protein
MPATKKHDVLGEQWHVGDGNPLALFSDAAVKPIAMFSTKARAAMAASSPEMYAALEMCLTDMLPATSYHGSKSDLNEAILRARAALEKARPA